MSLEHLLLCPANQLLDPEKALEERVISQIHEIRLVGFSHMLLLYNVPSFGMDGGSSRCYLRPRGIKHKVWKSLKKSHATTMRAKWAIFVLYFCEISDILRIILLPWKIKWDIFGWFYYTVIRGILSPVYEYWVVLFSPLLFECANNRDLIGWEEGDQESRSSSDPLLFC